MGTTMKKDKTRYVVLVYVCVYACVCMCNLKHSDGGGFTHKMTSDQRYKGSEVNVDTLGGEKSIFKNGLVSTKSQRLECACNDGVEEEGWCQDM